MRKSFTPSADIGPQFREIAGTELRGALRAAAEPGKPVRERVHDARTRIKHLRSLMRLVEPSFPGFETENAAARDAARVLSPLRDAAVLEQTLGRLVEANKELPGAADLGRAIDDLIPGPARQQDKLTTFAHETLQILDRVADWRLEEGRLSVLADGAARAYKSGRQAMDRAGESPTAEAFHEWRKQVKHQIYALGFMRELPGVPTDRLKPLKSLADLLGLHHDFDVFIAFAASRGKDQFGSLIEAAERERKGAERKALRLGKRLFAKRPRKWRAKLAEVVRADEAGT